MTGWLDKRTVDALARGAGVVLLDGAAQIATTRAVSYKTTWWKAGDSYDANNCGTLVYDHPVTRAMAPDGWCGRRMVPPDRRRQQVRSGKDAGQARRDHHRTAEHGLDRGRRPALRGRRGRGTLIVSGLNHARAKGRPENEWLIARLIDRAAGLPRPIPNGRRRSCRSSRRPPKAACPASAVWYRTKARTLPGTRAIERMSRSLVCRQRTRASVDLGDGGPAQGSQGGAGDVAPLQAASVTGPQPKTDGLSWKSTASRRTGSTCPSPRRGPAPTSGSSCGWTPAA